ncbi:MAG: type IV pilus modification PilV family protein [Rubrobacteraceae bacterium]|nr:prepilin-type N-terminal cleavage/methylation domain-containing protein [Rubrobacter sp.]
MNETSHKEDGHPESGHPESGHSECGYSLIEAVVAILILAVAILPMASMFDSALTASQSGGDYDKARALAHRTLEEIRALDFERAVEEYESGTLSNCASGKFSCEVEAEFVDGNLAPTTDSKTRMLVAVEVEWDGKSFETSGLVAAGRP